MKLRHTVAVCLLGLISFSGCGGGKSDVSKERLKAMAGGQIKDVVVVKGVVKVDGSPVGGVNLFMYVEGDYKVIHECRTEPDGKYCWSTYKDCDGVEPGSYQVGFTYVPKPKKNDTGVDLFKGKYQHPDNRIKLKVEAGSPKENVDYDLVTK